MRPRTGENAILVGRDRLIDERGGRRVLRIEQAHVPRPFDVDVGVGWTNISRRHDRGQCVIQQSRVEIAGRLERRSGLRPRIEKMAVIVPVVERQRHRFGGRYSEPHGGHQRQDQCCG